MTERSSSSSRTFVALAAVALGCLVATFALSEDEARQVEDASPSAAHDSAQGRKLGHWSKSRGLIPSRPVDPASPGYEGKESDDWDAIGSDERVERTEEIVARSLAAIAEAESGQEQQRHRREGLLALSAARADYFADDSGKTRYIELERALEG